MAFEDEFAKGEKEAARLVARMRAALQRAEAFEAQAAREARYRRRAGGEPGRQLPQETGGRRPEDSVRRRLSEEAALNRQIEQRNQLSTREERSLAAQERAMRRLRALGPAAYTQGVLFGPAGGPPRQLPPGGGGYAPPPSYYQQRQLPPGPPPPLQIGPGRQPLALPRPGETVGGSQFYDRETKGAKDASRAFREHERAQKSMGRENAQFARGLSQTLLIQSQANNQYQRFGALSAEWIGAAQRGTTTISELGRQTAVTVGKFGGWLVAGSLLYTALGAVRAIGEGAIDSASGVNQLQRVVNNVDPAAAQRGFRSRSEKFNLPISDVAGAAYEMGKIFHDQNEALEATDAVLYSVKVGELEYADAARYLTAITRGFNLEANQTTLIFDQINQAQNRLGVSIRDTEAGLAKASGTFSAAGGEGIEGFTKLLALMSVAQKATGQTGDVIGTAFARVPNFLRREESAETLTEFGLDPKAPIDELVEKAIKVAEGISGEKRQQLAAAIFGPFYGARVGTPLLQRGFGEYQHALREVDPSRAAGSGQRELDRLLESMRELISKIGTELQVLGSNLAQAGFLDVFGAGVKLLGQMLVATNNVLELFNLLPQPLTKTLAILAEIYAVILLLRKFNLGDSFAAGSVGNRLFTSPDQFQKRYGEDLRGQLDTLVGERERATATATRSAIGVNTAKAQAVYAEKEYSRLVGIHGAESQQSLAQKQNVLRAQGAVNAAEERKLAAELAELEILGAQKVVEDKKTALALARNEAEARQLAARYGDQVSTSFNRPVTAEESARQRGFQIATDREGNFQFVPLAAGGGADPAAATKQSAEKTRVIRNRLAYTGRAWADLARTQVSLVRPLASYEAVTDNARQAMTKTTRTVGVVSGRALPAAGTAIARGATAMRGLASSLYSFIGGPIGALLVGGFLVAEFADDLGRELAGGQAEIDRIDSFLANQPESMKELQDSLKLYDEFTTQQLDELIAGAGDFEAAGANGFSAQRAVEYRRLLEARKRARARGEKLKPLFDPESQEQQEGPEYAEVIERLELEGKIQEARLGRDKVGVARVGLRTASRILGILRKEGIGGKKEKEAVLGVIEARQTLREELRQEQAELIEATVNLAVARAGDDPVAAARASLQGARQKAKLADTEAERKNALAEVVNARRALRDAIRQEAEDLADANAALAEARAGNDPVAQAAARLRSVRVKLRFARTPVERRTALADVINARREFEEAIEQQAQDLAEADISILEARAGGDPVLEAKAQIERAETALRFSKTEADRRNALADLIKAQQQLDEAYAGIALARIGLQISSTEDPVKQATLRVREADLELQNADGQQEKLEARGRRREAVRSRRDAIAQKRIDNVEFDADLERITTEQEIARYENILRTAELGREQKRSLLRRIHDLNKELSGDSDQFELDVGNIKLPTIYDIRRAIGEGGASSSSASYVDNSTNTVQATINGGDPDEVMALMSGSFNRHNRAARRSAGRIP